MKGAFYIGGSSHAYSSGCMAKYIGSKLEDNMVNIRFPISKCRGSLEAKFCRSIFPAEIFDRWGKGMCKALINISDKFYCPFPGCPALLINYGTEAVKNSICPNCNRMLCAQCKVPWHEGIECSGFEKLIAEKREKEDGMLTCPAAKNNKWRRCPKCKFYVAKSLGSNYMTCSFCCVCGGTYTKLKGCNICICYQQRNIYPTQQHEDIPFGVFTGEGLTGKTFHNGRLKQTLSKVIA